MAASRVWPGETAFPLICMASAPWSRAAATACQSCWETGVVGVATGVGVAAGVLGLPEPVPVAALLLLDPPPPPLLDPPPPPVVPPPAPLPVEPLLLVLSPSWIARESTWLQLEYSSTSVGRFWLAVRSWAWV